MFPSLQDKPVDAAVEVMTQLIAAAGYIDVERQLVAQVLDNNNANFGNLLLAYQSSLTESAGSAAELAEYYGDGVSMVLGPVGGGVDVAISVDQGYQGNYYIAAIGLIPFVPSAVLKTGNKVALKVGGQVIKRLPAQKITMMKRAVEYAKLVNTNEWGKKGVTWNKKIAPGLSDAQKEEIRAFARELDLIPHIPVNKITKFADFSSVRMKSLPRNSGSPVSYLPRSLWKKSDTAQFQYLMKNHFPDLHAQGKLAPDGYTWHHRESSGGMELVPTGIHNATFHNGGRSPGRWGYPRP